MVGNPLSDSKERAEQLKNGVSSKAIERRYLNVEGFRINRKNLLKSDETHEDKLKE